jgi:hypothetical protein
VVLDSGKRDSFSIRIFVFFVGKLTDFKETVPVRHKALKGQDIWFWPETNELGEQIKLLCTISIRISYFPLKIDSFKETVYRKSFKGTVHLFWRKELVERANQVVVHYLDSYFVFFRWKIYSSKEMVRCKVLKGQSILFWPEDN